MTQGNTDTSDQSRDGNSRPPLSCTHRQCVSGKQNRALDSRAPDSGADNAKRDDPRQRLLHRSVRGRDSARYLSGGSRANDRGALHVVGGQSVSNLFDMCRGVGALSARRAVDVPSASGDLRRRSTGWPRHPNRQSRPASSRRYEPDAARANDSWFGFVAVETARRQDPERFVASLSASRLIALARQMCFNKLRSSGCS